MPKRKQIIIGNKEFKTIKELKAFTKQLLKNRGVCEINRSDNDFNFFIDLYFRKPSNMINIENKDKIQKFKIGLNPIKKDEPNHMLIIINNKEYVFSWNKCCEAKNTEDDTKLKEACRSSIEEQTRDCWINNICCNNCKKPKQNGFQVDHINEFSNIFNEFIDSTTLKIPINFDSDPYTSQYIFKKDDNNFKQSFQIYHKENALLQLLCIDCHKEKTKRFISKK